jgi:hypothetical protein
VQGRHRKPPARAHFVVPVVSAVGVLGIGGVSAAAALSGGSGDDGVVMPRVVPTLVVPPVVSPSPTVVAPPSSPAAAAHRAAPRRVFPGVTITAVSGVSWVQVVGPHGRVLYVGMLRRGHTVRFAQRPLVVTLGNAGAVRVVHGSSVIRRAGKPGEVRVLRYA